MNANEQALYDQLIMTLQRVAECTNCESCKSMAKLALQCVDHEKADEHKKPEESET